MLRRIFLSVFLVTNFFVILPMKKEAICTMQDSNNKQQEKDKALFAACKANNTRLASVLIRNCANVNAVNERGESLLDCTCCRGNKIFPFLDETISYGDPTYDECGFEEFYDLVLWYEKENLNTIRLLVENGAALTFRYSGEALLYKMAKGYFCNVARLRKALPMEDKLQYILQWIQSKLYLRRVAKHMHFYVKKRTKTMMQCIIRFVLCQSLKDNWGNFEDSLFIRLINVAEYNPEVERAILDTFKIAEKNKMILRKKNRIQFINHLIHWDIDNFEGSLQYRLANYKSLLLGKNDEKDRRDFVLAMKACENSKFKIIIDGQSGSIKVFKLFFG